VPIAIPAPEGYAHGIRSFELRALARGSQAAFGGQTPITLLIPTQPWELRAEDPAAQVEVRGGDAWLNVSPGGHAEATLTLVNHADHDLTLLWHDGAQPGLATSVSPASRLLLPASSATTATLRVDASADALLVLRTLDVAFSVDNTQRQTDGATTLHVQVVPLPATLTAQDTSAGGIPGGVVAGGAIVGAVACGAAVAIFLRRDATRYALAVLLYTRMAKSQALEHPGREEIHRLVAQQPGISYSGIQRTTDMNTGTLVHHLRALERSGMLVSRKEAGARRFWVASAPPARDAAPALTPMQARVMAMLEEQPLTQGEIAQRLGLSQQGANHHVKTLERAGRIEPVLRDGAWRYQPVTAFEVLPA
jgi:DNA-binding MarR family transcriptional regulator